MELLLAEEERKAANKVSGKKGASVQKKQDKSSGPNIGSSNTSSQEAAATSLKPARMHLTLPAAAADTAASAETAAAAFSSQERFGEQAYAHMAAEVLANPPCHLPGFAKPNVDCHAIDQEYATQYEQLLAEEAARVAAESSPSASPAHLPADSAGQVAGLISTTAPACAPVSLAEGTKEKASSLLIGELDQADAASQASHTPVCVYPDDFMVRCLSATQAAALMTMYPTQFIRRDETGAEVLLPFDPLAVLVNGHRVLQRYLRCPLSQVSTAVQNSRPITDAPSPLGPSCAQAVFQAISTCLGSMPAFDINGAPP